MTGSAKCKLWIGIVISFICISMSSENLLHAETRELSLGVTYVDEPISTFKRWEPLGVYLSKLINADVKVVPLDFAATVQWMETGKIQMVLTNPLAFMIAKDKAQLVAIAMVVQKQKGEMGDKYGSVIIVKSDSSIKTLQELSGKNIGIASRFSLGGGLGGLALLEQEGVKVEQVNLKELKTQDNVVFAVLNGTVDVGIIRTGILEKLASEKKINIGDLKILHKVDDSFPFAHSTPLWPEWIFAVRSSDVSQQERDHIKKGLIGLSGNNEVLLKSNLSGFKDPTEAINANAQFFDFVLKVYHKISK
ncbi:MAG: phosphate/phosphite/phosphonate ABC transporter substrate-binding protein [Thermodesulforhabdaceae bacterium]